ncbi:hypothetical protein ACIP5Y_46775 [Nocardia sp. NPDC088792]|uniref:hypothetical protein n=1 Tax=Nocardia sp. NPDC088792 TaxID=3364332 RepID=UPI003801FF04
MSQISATQADGSTRRTAQVFRYGAIVTAGMASIGLTVAAGSYIANEMALRPGKLIAEPAANQPPIDLGTDGAAPRPVQAGPIAESFIQNAVFPARIAETATPQLITEHGVAGTAYSATGTQPRVGAQVHLGNTFVGAQVVPVQHDSVSVTVDTNVFATLTDLLLHTPLGEQLGITGDPAAVTRFQTDVNTRGVVTVTLTDPGLGHYVATTTV